MCRLILAVILAAGLMLTSNGAIAAGEDVTVLGAGHSTCGNWTKERGAAYKINAAVLAMQTWVMGYLRGVFDGRKDRPDPLRLTDADAISGWIDNYCREHPLDSIYYAAGNLAAELLKRSVE